MTIEIWIRQEDLEALKRIQSVYMPEPISKWAVKYSTLPTDDTQHCVNIDYDSFVRLLDNELLIKL